MDNNEFVWIEETAAGDTIFASDGVTTPVQLPDVWDIGGDVISLDFEESVIVSTQGEDFNSRLVMRDLDRDVDVLFQNPYGSGSIVVGTSVPSFSPRSYSPGTAMAYSGSSLNSTGTERIQGYDLALGRAIDSTVVDTTVQTGSQVGSYIRPSIEFFYDGEISYSAEMLDGSTLASNGFSFETRSAGDINGDGAVNVVDLGLLRSKFFMDDDEADLTNDGVVNVEDLGVLRLNFFSRANLNFGYLTWDSSAVPVGSSATIEVIMTINDATQFRKQLVYTASP